MALTKAEMAEKLFEDLGLNKREAKELVEMFFEEVRGALENALPTFKCCPATFPLRKLLAPYPPGFM